MGVRIRELSDSAHLVVEFCGDEPSASARSVGRRRADVHGETSTGIPSTMVTVGELQDAGRRGAAAPPSGLMNLDLVAGAVVSGAGGAREHLLGLNASDGA